MRRIFLLIGCTIFAYCSWGQKLAFDSLEKLVDRTMFSGYQEYFITQNPDNNYLSDNELYRFIHRDAVYHNYHRALFHKRTATRLNIARQTHLDYCKKIGKLSKLEFLDISNVYTARWGNSIREIPDGVYKLSNLKILIANNTNIKQIPHDISKLENLEVLSLRDGNIRDLPAEMFGLKKLKVLDLSRNNIASLPDEIGNLSELQVLILSGNPLKSLPSSISKCVNLEFIVYSLPQKGNGAPNTESIGYLSSLPNLKFLFLNYSNIITTPFELQNFRNLKYLSLKGNYKLDLPNIFSGLSKIRTLKVLDLSFSRINSVPDDIGKMTNLETIYLGNCEYFCPNLVFFGERPYNDITSLPSTIKNLGQLKYLYLWAWKIEQPEQRRISLLLPNTHIEFESKR